MKKPYAIIWPVIVALIPFLMYLRTLCPVVFAGDSSEFVSVIQTPTIAHPPGYPLYILFGWLFTRLPFGLPAFEANALSAVFGALSVLVLFNCFIRISGKVVAAVAAALLMGFGNIFWRMSSVAEVYTLGVLMLGLTWFAAMRAVQKGDHVRWIDMGLIGLMFGLGFANHQSIIFILPGLLVYLLWGKKGPLTNKTWVPLVIGVLIGLALYFALIPLSASSGPGDVKISGVGDLWKYATRQAYFNRGPEAVGVAYAGKDLVKSSDIAATLVSGLFKEWGPIFFLIGLAGFVVLYLSNKRLASGIIVSIVGTFLGLCFLTKGSPLGMPKVDMKVSELLPPLLPLFAFGFVGALDAAYNKLLSSDQLVGEESFIPKKNVPIFLGAFYVAMPLVLMLFNLNTSDMSGHVYTYRMGENALKGVNTPASIFTIGDEYYLFRELIKVEGQLNRPDGTAADANIYQAADVRIVLEGSGEELDSVSSVATKIRDEIRQKRRVYLTYPPGSNLLDSLKGGGIHMEHVGLIYEAVSDTEPWGAPGDGPMRFSHPGAEAGIWEFYDLEHLTGLAQVPADPMELPYLRRYYDEAVNYAEFYLNDKKYEISAEFYTKAYQYGGLLAIDPAPIIPKMAVSFFHTHNQNTQNILQLAVDQGIDFPERDPYRANILYSIGNIEGIELARRIYSENSLKLLDPPLIEGLVDEDITNKNYKDALEKTLDLVGAFTTIPRDQPLPPTDLQVAIALSENPILSDAYWFYAYISLLTGDMPTTEILVRHLTNLSPESLNSEVSNLLQSEDYEHARVFYELILRSNPGDYRAAEGLAVCLFGLGDIEAAKKLAEEVFIHRPESTNLKNILGIEPEKPQGEDEGVPPETE